MKTFTKTIQTPAGQIVYTITYEPGLFTGFNIIKAKLGDQCMVELFDGNMDRVYDVVGEFVYEDANPAEPNHRTDTEPDIFQGS